jgi:hypothetical protein
LLHNSSGAGKFKASRGAIREIEYTGVYLKHLNIRRKLGWALIEFLTNQFMLKIIKNKDLS